MKKFIIKTITASVLQSLLLISVSHATMTPQETREFVKESFTKVIENRDVADSTYAEFFSKDYIQHVDGQTLTYSDFVAHMKAQKAVVKSIKVAFKHLVVENDKVATVHTIHAVKKDGGVVVAQVNALFQIKDKKFILCDELTHLIKGEKADKDLGSRR